MSMRRRLGVATAVCAFVPTMAFGWPWSQDMMNQPSVKPEEPMEYGGMMQMMPFPERSIPVSGIPTKVADREEAKALVNPVPVTNESITEGRNLYRIYCATCHGFTGAAESPIASKIGAIALNDSYVQENLTEGWIWGTITFGSYVMPAYGVTQGKRGSNDLSVEERWHVVNYIKHGLSAEKPSATTASLD